MLAYVCKQAYINGRISATQWNPDVVKWLQAKDDLGDSKQIFVWLSLDELNENLDVEDLLMHW